MQIFLLCDAVAPFPERTQDALPGWSAEHTSWTRRVMPANLAGDCWILHFHCFLIIEESGATLVDAGIGGPASPASRWLGTSGRLPELLAERGVHARDITTVVLTHVHLDHAGWTLWDTEPRFPNASYVVQRAERNHASNTETYRELIAPVERAGQLREIDGEVRLSPSIRILPSPGHTPGHQSVLTRDVLLCGDALVHPAQARYPHLGYAYDFDVEVASAKRAEVLRQCADADLVLMPSHTQGGLRVTAADGVAASDGLTGGVSGRFVSTCNRVAGMGS